MNLPTANAIWIGPKLGPIHAACLRSFVRAGHRVVLHSYDPPSDVPSGIELADARKLMPESRIVRYKKSGSPALFANLFRYQLLKAGLGLYIDCDVYCVRPIEDADYVLGWQDQGSLNNAVLKLPPDCPVLAELCNLKDGFIPPWSKSQDKRRLRLRQLLGRPLQLEEMRWGTTGPKALTWYAQQHGLVSKAAPIDVFYPVAMSHIGLLIDPALSLDELITPRTRAVHLWSQIFANAASGLPPNVLDRVPPTSPLGRIIAS